MPLFNPKKEVSEIPKGLEGLYNKSDSKDKDGKELFKLKPEVENAVFGNDLTEENKKLKGRITELEKAASKLEDTQITLKEGKENEKEKEKIEKNKEKEDAALREMRKQTEALKLQLKEQEQKNQTLKADFDARQKRSMIADEIRAKSGSVALLAGHVDAKTGFKDGSLYVKDKDGDPVFVGSQQLKVGDWLDELKKEKEYAPAFQSEKQGVGTNFSPSGAGKPIKKPGELSYNSLSPEDEIKLIKEHGSEAYTAAMQKISGEKMDKIQKENQELLGRQSLSAL